MKSAVIRLRAAWRVFWYLISIGMWSVAFQSAWMIARSA